MIKVLQVLPSLNYCGGVENYLMNYYRHVNKDDVTFDFAYHLDGEPNFVDEISQNGDKVYKLPPFTLGDLKNISDGIEEIFKNNHYDIVHCHQANAAFLYFKIAKKYNVKIRIIHSHQTRGADKFSHRVRNYPLLWVGKRRASHYVGCSGLAGKFLFGRKKYKVINNAIELDKYKFNEQKRVELREKYRIDLDDFVVGNIGRLCNQKNQVFLTKVCKSLVSKGYENIHFIVVGDGELRDMLRREVEQNNLNNFFTFTGPIANTNEIYNVFDLFVLPSLYEGLPVVGVEAQANGLKVFTSTNVTTELNFSNNVSYFSLNNINAWVDAVIEVYNSSSKNNNRNVVNNSDTFDINKECVRLVDYYKELLNENKD